jgi:hypothetical protein
MKSLGIQRMSGKHNLEDDSDLQKSKRMCKTGKERSNPKRKTKSINKSQGKVKWNRRSLLARYAVATEVLTQTKSLYNRDIGEQLAECFLGENGSRGIIPSSESIDEDIGLPVNPEQDMSDAV